MGILNIIKNCDEESPASDAFPENGPFFDDEDPPVIVGIYSDVSDTESFSGLEDANELLEIEECPSSLSSDFDSDVEDENSSEILLLTDGQENVCKIEEKPSSNHTNNKNEEKSESCSSNLLGRMKSKSIKNRANLGKKKARRLENARQLDLLVGNDVDDCDINDFMPSEYSFRFSQILQDSDLANKILNPVCNNDVAFENLFLKDDQIKKKKPQSTRTKKLSGHDAFNNLDAFEKTFFRRRNLPMGMVQYLDTCVVSFFEKNPTGTYISEPLSSYERMILHSIAHYYDLNSFSFDNDNRKGRSTKVINNFNYFNPPCLGLSQYIDEHLYRNSCSGPVKRRRFRRR